MNPTIKQETLREIPKKLPIRVELVVRSLDDAKSQHLQEIKKFCQEQAVFFETRLYDSYRSKYDRDEIVTLPAFHIFVNSIYQKTFYPAHRPFQIIFDTAFEYKKKVEEKQEKKGRWKKAFKSLWVKLKSLGERKTRMEKEAEIQERVRRMSYQKEQEDFDRRIRSHHEWS